MPYLIALAAFAATLLGGLFALRFKDKLHLILGFSAGAVIGVAFFDLIPEAIELASGTYDVAVVTAVMALGFVGFMLLDRLVVGHTHGEGDNDEAHGHNHAHASRGILGAASLATHSFLDGLAVGLAFQVSAAVGAIVATAVLVHDFSDGINTVNLIIKNNGNRRRAFSWLLVDAITPVLGIIASTFFVLPEAGLGLMLGLFCGFFLYIGASDLLPESYHRHPTLWTTFMTVLGMGVLYGAIHFAGV